MHTILPVLVAALLTCGCAAMYDDYSSYPDTSGVVTTNDYTYTMEYDVEDLIYAILEVSDEDMDVFDAEMELLLILDAGIPALYDEGVYSDIEFGYLYITGNSTVHTQVVAFLAELREAWSEPP